MPIQMVSSFLLITNKFSYLCIRFCVDVMSEKSYKLPAICWLRVTDFMGAWLQYELGGGARVKELRVVSVQHLEGARKVLRMETVEDVLEPSPVVNAMSATRHGCITAGMTLDEGVTQQLYGITRQELEQFMPVECPRLALTKNGVLRPWTDDTCFGVKQATALQRLLREAFWQGVGEFARKYAHKRQGEKYPQEEMVRAFCKETGTSDIHVPGIRREWQRRVKRKS